MPADQPKSLRGAKLAPLQFLSPLHKASRQLSIYLQGQLEGRNLSAIEAHVLAYLCRFAPCPVGELAKVFGLNKSTLTGVLDRLEQERLIARAVNSDDRRSFIVTVTRSGEREGAAIRMVTEMLEKEISNRITEADLRGFQRVMAAIAEVTQVQVRPERKPTQP